jgi:hypothetical protein
MRLWKRIEISTLEHPPALLGADDICYYARDYISKGGYKSSEANQLILNLKKDISKKGTHEWQYKIRAIKQFSTELAGGLLQDYAVAFIPTSKLIDDPACDPRWEILKDELASARPDLKFKRPIVRRESCSAVHSGGARKMAAIRATLDWRGFKNVPDTIILIDDVITAGAHFKVCKNMILERHPDVKVYGIFWARTIWPESDSDSKCPF